MLLNCHSWFSLKYGTIPPETLLSMAKEQGHSCVALTDINNTSAVLDFIRLAPKHDIRPVVGVDFRHHAQRRFVALARNNEGFRQINDLLSHFLHNKDEEVPYRFPFNFHFQHSSTSPSVRVFWQSQNVSRTEGGNSVFVIYPFSTFLQADLAENEFLGVHPRDFNRLKMSPWLKRKDKLVLMRPVSFRQKKDFNAHRILRAIDHNLLLSKLPEDETGDPDDRMYGEEAIREELGEYQFLADNAQQLLEQCHIEFDFSGEKPNNQEFYTTSRDLDFRLMRKLAYDGLPYRYPKPTSEIIDRLEMELGVIRNMGFVSYFLINWKILKYARSKGYYYVGRGSGANSIVAYLLRITDVDPVELDLYFERFINLYRKNPPDFDIDFSWQDREDVTEFIFRRFPNTALLAAYNTFQYRAAVREIGKVFGLPKAEIDQLSTGNYRESDLDQLKKLVLIYSQYIDNFPNYISIHAAGILISEKHIHHYSATFMPPKGFPTVQFDMITAEDIGLYKFDILSQRGLGKIRDCETVIRYNHPNAPPIDIHDLARFKADPNVRQILRDAEAIGCFYIESPAMRMLLRKLRVDSYLGLVAASSVIRPGVSKSGMMREYILRFRNPGRRAEAHPVLADIMPETYGIMVYQEDVIKVAHYYGGLTLGEADMLRRGMSGKFRSREEFHKVKDKFFSNCLEKGEPPEETQEIWRQIESFAGYAFAKGHSASYAVESYQSLFLKAYYPLEYMVATVNNGGGFYRPSLYVHEARLRGGDIQPPCVNNGSFATIIRGRSIYLGMAMLKSLESALGKRIAQERIDNGAFQSLDDFIDRVPVSVEQLAILIKVNALRFTRRNKRELLWEAHMKINKVSMEERVNNLFKVERVHYRTPDLPGSIWEDAFDEWELLGFPLCNPFDLLAEEPDSDLVGGHLYERIGQQVTITVWLVHSRRTRTHRGENMFFGVFLDRVGAFVDTVHFPKVAEKYPFSGQGIYSVTGTVMEEFDCINIQAESMRRLKLIEDPRYSEEEPKPVGQPSFAGGELRSASIEERGASAESSQNPDGSDSRQITPELAKVSDVEIVDDAPVMPIFTVSRGGRSSRRG